MDAQWRQGVTDDARKSMITDMFHELLRISGERDKRLVWSSAAKFELMIWSNCTDQTTYTTKMQQKIRRLKEKPSAGHAQSLRTVTASQGPTTMQPLPVVGKPDEGSNAAIIAGGLATILAAADTVAVATTKQGQATSAKDAQWRQNVSYHVRKSMITDMFHEALRISGISDKRKVWCLAAEFEVKLWTTSTDQTTYMTKMQDRILSLRRKPCAPAAVMASTGTTLARRGQR